MYWKLLLLIRSALCVIVQLTADDSSFDTAQRNSESLTNMIINANSSVDRIVNIPAGLYFFTGGITIIEVSDVTVTLDGNMVFLDNYKNYPTRNNGSYLELWSWDNCHGISMIGGNGSSIDGSGYIWWFQSLLFALKMSKLKSDSRPKLMSFTKSSNLEILNMKLLNSPFFHLNLDDVANVLVQNLTVKVSLYPSHSIKRYRKNHRRSVIADIGDHISYMSHQVVKSISETSHRIEDWLDVETSDIQRASESTMGSIGGYLKSIPDSIAHWLSTVAPIFPLNTDGIDPSGVNITIRNFYYLGYDDAVAVKPQNRNSKYSDCTNGVLVENADVKWSTGMAIGTVPSRRKRNCISGVVFRNVRMEKPFKAIYIKTNPGDTDGVGIINNIVYENFHVKESIWWPIYLGTQQQQQPDGGGPGCFNFPKKDCPTNPLVSITNVTLRNIRMTTSHSTYAGAIRCNKNNPCTGFKFENIRLTAHKNLRLRPKSRFKIICENINGSSKDVSPSICF
jgi:Glycosyl hydrolases family 28